MNLKKNIEEYYLSKGEIHFFYPFLENNGLEYLLYEAYMSYDNTISKVKDVKTSAPKNTKPYIVQVLSYLYNMRIPFDTRMGLKKIYYTMERDPISKEINQVMKELYVSLNMKPHASGEYPVPNAMEKYNYLLYTDISEDGYSFRPKKIISEFANLNEANLHREAVEIYFNHHYRGSEEEIADLEYKDSLIEKRRMSKIAAVESEMEYISENLELDIPIDCKIVNKKTYITLQINSFEAYIAVLENGLYDMFDDQTVKYGVEYKIDLNYYKYWDDNRDDNYAQAIDLLRHRFKIIDNYPAEIGIETMKSIKINTMSRAKKLLAHYMGDIKVREADKMSLFQMVEDYFETKGIEAVIVERETLMLRNKDGSYTKHIFPLLKINKLKIYA